MYRQSDKDVEDKQARRRVAMVGALFAMAFAISIGTFWLDQKPPEPNFSGYYDGAWVNKRGELVGADGQIENHVYSGPEFNGKRLPDK